MKISTSVIYVILAFVLILSACGSGGPIPAEASTGERALPLAMDTIPPQEKTYEDGMDFGAIAGETGVSADTLETFNPDIPDEGIPAYTVIQVPEVWRFRWKVTLDTATIFSQGVEISVVNREEGALIVKFLGNMCAVLGDISAHTAFCVVTNADEWTPVVVNSIENACYQWAVNSTEIPEICP